MMSRRNRDSSHTKASSTLVKTIPIFLRLHFLFAKVKTTLTEKKFKVAEDNKKNVTES
jgi:hypothetical protein